MPAVPATLDWLFWTIGGLVAIGSLWMLIRALFRDRARGRYRCPKCWYELTAAGGAAPALPVLCSECGRTTLKLRRLRRTRRRWRWALFALMLIPAAGTIAYYPSAMRNGWWSIVPTRFLVDTIPVFGYPSLLTDELLRRHGLTNAPPGSPAGLNWRQSPRLSIADQIYLIDRVALGNWLAHPTSKRWQRSYGRFQQDFCATFFCLGFAGFPGFGADDPALRRAIEQLYAIPMVVELRTRAHWPEGYPLYVETMTNHWWPFPTSERVVARDLESDVLHEPSSPCGFVIDGLSGSGAGVLKFDVRVYCLRQAEPNAEWLERQQIFATVPFRIGGSIDDVIKPAIDPAIDRLVSAITHEVGEGVISDTRSTLVKATRGVAFGVIIEHLFEGQLQTVERAWWIGGPIDDPNRSRDGREWIEDDPRLPPPASRRYPGDAKRGDNWTVRIRSDPETALRVIDADRYWVGDVTIPLTIW